VAVVYDTWNGSTDSGRQAVASAIGAAERAAETAGHRPGPYRSYAADAERVPSAAHARPAAMAAANAAYAAFAVSYIARGSKVGAAGRGDAERAAAGFAAANAANAANAAANTAATAIRADAYRATRERIVATMWRDYHLLAGSTAGQGWTDATPVAPDLFGPLWPDGEPAGWLNAGPEEPEQESPHSALAPPTIAVAWDLAAVSPDEYAEIVESLGDIVRGAGGVGIKHLRSEAFHAPTPTGRLSSDPTDGLEPKGAGALDEPVDPASGAEVMRFLVDVYATQVSPQPRTTLPVVRAGERYRTWAEIWFGVQQHLRRIFVSLSSAGEESPGASSAMQESDTSSGGSRMKQLPAPNAAWAQTAKGQAQQREESRQVEVDTSLARSDFWSDGSGHLKGKLSALRVRGAHVELREVEPDVWSLVLATTASRVLAASAATGVLGQTGRPGLERGRERE
jgi:hypothetical protein